MSADTIVRRAVAKSSSMSSDQSDSGIQYNPVGHFIVSKTTGCNPATLIVKGHLREK